MVFLAKLVQIPDVQCAWLLLLYCAASRCNHTLRTLPPDLSQDYAERHDIAMRRTLSEILGRSDINQTNEILCALCTMKHSHGGLGLRSARRTAPAAYWASIADTIPEIQKRYPRFAQRIVQWLNSSDSIPHSMTEAAEARRHLINSVIIDVLAGKILLLVFGLHLSMMSNRVNGHMDGNFTLPPT